MKISIATITLFIVVLLFCSFEELNVEPSRISRIIIDAGHGGKDTGCVGHTEKESKVALEIALHLGAILKADMKDVQVEYTRKTDEFMELRERARFANQNRGDLLISIHCNASKSPALFGSETYYMGTPSDNDTYDRNVALFENSVILMEKNHKTNYGGFDPNDPLSHIMMANYHNVYQANSSKLAHGVEKQFRNTLRRKSRGVKQGEFLLLWKAAMPSILVETGFLTNPEDVMYLKNEKSHGEVATAIFRAIKEYRNN